MAAFRLLLDVLFDPLYSFTDYHAIGECLSANEFQISLILPWMYPDCFFFFFIYVVSYYRDFLSFFTVEVVGFLLLSKEFF